MIDPANPRCGGPGIRSTHVFISGTNRAIPPGSRPEGQPEPKDTDRCQCGQFTYLQIKQR